MIPIKVCKRINVGFLSVCKLTVKGVGKNRHKLNLNEVILQFDDGADREPF